MSTSVGFRVEPKRIHFAVLKGNSEDPRLVDEGRFSAPQHYAEAEALTWYRTRTGTLLEKHRPGRAAVKYMESIAGRGRPPRSTDNTRRRHRIEGVLLQVLHERGVGTSTGPFATITSRLGSDSAKAYLDREEFRGLDWGSKTKLLREAILVGVAALGRD